MGLFLLMDEMWPLYFLVNGVLFFLFFFFNFLALVEFHLRHDHITLYFLPIYHIFKYAGLGILILSLDESSSLPFATTEFAVAAVIFGVLELAVGLFMLTKMNVIEPVSGSNERTHR